MPSLLDVNSLERIDVRWCWMFVLLVTPLIMADTNGGNYLHDNETMHFVSLFIFALFWLRHFYIWGTILSKTGFRTLLSIHIPLATLHLDSSPLLSLSLSLTKFFDRFEISFIFALIHTLALDHLIHVVCFVLILL